MKRTGHSGPFPLSGHPVFPPTSNGKDDFSRVSRSPQEQTINKPIIMPDLPDLSLGIPDSNSPRQSPLQTPTSLMIGGRSNMVSPKHTISVWFMNIKISNMVYWM
jgi:hypothetical protein